MCGIAGWITSRSGAAAPETLRAMTDAIAHRGPDDSGHDVRMVTNDAWSLGLGHRRLTIIDVSQGGHQPKSTPDGRWTVVFNGEIYNYIELREELRALGRSFETTSDTEVLLQAFEVWDLEALKRFRGMFAFALWDARDERLILARDPFGKKPLYLHERKTDAGTDLLYGSEIDALLAHPACPRDLDEDSLYHFLVNRYVPAPETFFKGIRKLMPATALVWQNGRVTEHQYWTPPDGTARGPLRDPADPVGQFMEVLDEAVQIRMRSDVPFGAYLSGGLDSSAVVSIMARHSDHPINTFSVGFQEAEFSELNEAGTVARQFGCNHHELVVTASEVMDYLPRLIRHRAAPVTESSDVPIFLLSHEAARHVKMVLTGEGSDEVLGGYPKHRFERYVRSYQSVMPGFAHKALFNPMAQALPYSQRRVKIVAAAATERDFAERMQRWMGAMSSSERAVLWNKPAPSRPLHPYPFTTEKGVSPLRQMLYFDQTSWLPDNLLERGDRMTMAAGLEGRMPFMDIQLAAFMSGLPDHWRIKGSTTKRILREAMRDVLPSEILSKPKMGFRVPINEWFRTTMKDYVNDHLTGPNSRIHGILNQGRLRQIVDEHVSSRQNHEKIIWILVSLELFLQQYKL